MTSTLSPEDNEIGSKVAKKSASVVTSKICNTRFKFGE
jgi:hypothetical protein